MLESLIRLRLDLDKNSVVQVAQQLDNLRKEASKSFADNGGFEALKNSAISAVGNVRQSLKAVSTEINNFKERIKSNLQDLGSLKDGFDVVTSAAQRFYNSTIALNDQLERNLIATKGLLVSTTQIFQNGMQVTDTSAAMEALSEPLKKVLSDLKREGADLVTPFTQQSEIFQVVAGQISSMGGGLKDAKDLTLSFAASLDALGLPANQARQEINSLVSGMADQNSRLAQMLFGSSQQANAQIDLWKQEGTLIENLQAKMEGLKVSAKEATQTISGIASNIGDQIEQISVMVFEPLMEPAKQFLNTIYNGLEGLRDSVALQVFIQSFQGIIDNIASAWQQFTYYLENDNPFGGSLSEAIEKLKYLWLEFTQLLADAKPYFEIVGMGLARPFQLLIALLDKVIEGWIKIINLARMAGEAVGLVKEDRTWDTGPVRQQSAVEVRARILSEEEYNTPERLAAQWKAATSEIKREYDQAMDQVSLAAMRTETAILEATDSTKEGQRRAAMERAQIAIENAEKRLEIERNFQAQMQEQYAKQVEVVRATEAEIAKIKEGGITQDEATQLDELQQQLEKEKALEESVRKDIQKSREKEEKEKQNLIKETQKLEEEQKKQALEAIEMRKKAIAAYYDAAIKGQEALAQEIEQESERISKQIDLINEQITQLNLDKDFNLKNFDQELKQAEEASKIKIDTLKKELDATKDKEAQAQIQLKIQREEQQLAEKRQRIEQETQRISQEAAKKELALKKQILELEIKQQQLAARKAEVEAKKAVLQATKEIKAAEAELQKAQIQGDKEAIQSAQLALEAAKEGKKLAEDQLAFAKEEAKIQKQIAEQKRQTFAKQARNQLQEQGLNEEAEILNASMNEMGTTINKVAGGIQGMSSAMDKFGRSIANANSALGKTETLLGKIGGMSLGGASLNNLLGKAGQTLGNMMPNGFSGGLPGGASVGNLLGRERGASSINNSKNITINNNGGGGISTIGRQDWQKIQMLMAGP